MLVSCFNKCVIMCLLVKLDFAADLTLFPEYTIIIKINHPPLALSPYGGCVTILCGGFDATFMPWP